MHRSHHPHLAVLLSAVALLAGCSSSSNAPATQPVSTGTITGRVSLYEMDSKPSSSSAGVEVTMLGKSYHTTSDSTGRFVFDSLPAGYYQMRFTKPGFTTNVTQDAVPFVGADTLRVGTQASLYRINNWKVVLSQENVKIVPYPPSSGSDTTFYLYPQSSAFATTQDSTGNYVSVYGHDPTLAFYVGRTPNIDYRNTSSYFSSNVTTEYNYLSGSYANVDGALAQSDTIYLIAYPISGSSTNFEYNSGDTVKTEFTGFGPPSNTLQIVLP